MRRFPYTGSRGSEASYGFNVHQKQKNNRRGARRGHQLTRRQLYSSKICINVGTSTIVTGFTFHKNVGTHQARSLPSGTADAANAAWATCARTLPPPGSSSDGWSSVEVPDTALYLHVVYRKFET